MSAKGRRPVGEWVEWVERAMRDAARVGFHGKITIDFFDGDVVGAERVERLKDPPGARPVARTDAGS